MPLSWFLNSKVPGYEGTLWGADPSSMSNLTRWTVRHFRAYERAEYFARRCTDFFVSRGRRGSAAIPGPCTRTTRTRLLNPLNVVPLYTDSEPSAVPTRGGI